FANAQVKEAVNLHSGASNNLSIAEFKLERAQTKFDLEKPAEGETVEDQAALEAARQKLEEAEKALDNAKQEIALYAAQLNKWRWVARILAIIIGALLVIDAFLLPGLLRRREEYERSLGIKEQAYQIPDVEEGGDYSPAAQVHRPWLDWIDKLNGFVGEFICYWSIIAVFVYYYEVVARYFFNSPTNWAHEGMFLMFGMQYMLAAGYTLREGGHVHVDIIYNHFSERMKALVDILTSVFFFIFTLAILWSGWTFFMDSVQIWEVSFTEWAIAYWPIKLTIPLGALLLTLQGFTRLFKDIIFLTESKV
ncbi:MAG: TRAP transporter small permease subunit, partial [Desulfohalobiaceae bacterium]|nr:TRAP transporter small permease subunit [Desulfohalobiaceae bacterium]